MTASRKRAHPDQSGAGRPHWDPVKASLFLPSKLSVKRPRVMIRFSDSKASRIDLKIANRRVVANSRDSPPLLSEELNTIEKRIRTHGGRFAVSPMTNDLAVLHPILGSENKRICHVEELWTPFGEPSTPPDSPQESIARPCSLFRRNSMARPIGVRTKALHPHVRRVSAPKSKCRSGSEPPPQDEK